tara:strand:- start:1215 stop:1430 length:216 start_codon:yes stop_codon:yes gene_type:complete
MAVRRYRIEQPGSDMHGWVVEGTLSRLEKYDVECIAFSHDGIDYAVPLNWAAETDRAPRPAKDDGQAEMPL